jgi:autotransporter-associated beta strand protein
VDAADHTSLTITGVIAGPTWATLTKVGAGTVVLAAPNTYAGRTDVCAGILAVTDPAGLGTTTAGTAVENGATLELRGGVAVHPEPLTLKGAGVGGAGALRGVGGANAFAGAITLAGPATIAADAGASLAVNGAIANEGYLLTLGGAGDTNVSTTISGAGGLTKTGGGTLTFSGASPNLYAGTTMIDGGTLWLAKAPTIAAVSGSLLLVNAGGTLAGSGIVNTSVINAGVVSPGGTGAVGTLTVNGGYTQTATGSLNVELAGNGMFDALTVAGAARLNGVLNVALLGGYLPGPGAAFPVLSFASLTGVFGTVTGLGLGNGASLSVVYGPASVTLKR